ncbi:hypothetical protein BOA8489_03990 [Boseongicola aestuarii]|uniref:Uncharacterized protein n=1 Tax=Boseongicola aestuarii TaxID=1470561 RepID=A0A238J6T6_9RHOB|nr:hypothetical protein BOA8489_03990 [Boseongicola aestuarii]
MSTRQWEPTGIKMGLQRDIFVLDDRDGLVATHKFSLYFVSCNLGFFGLTARRIGHTAGISDEMVVLLE